MPTIYAKPMSDVSCRGCVRSSVAYKGMNCPPVAQRMLIDCGIVRGEAPLFVYTYNPEDGPAVGSLDEHHDIRD